MKLSVKPFTLFLCVAVIIFLIVGTRSFFLKGDNNDKQELLIVKEEPSWKGIITLWDISYIETGTGNRSRWLNNWVKKFEKQYPGIFIDVRRMTPDRVQAYFTGDYNEEYLPDIISLNNYEQTVPISMLEDLSPFFTVEEFNRLYDIAYQRVESEGKIYGVPWMMGGYALVFNQDMATEQGVLLDEIPPDYDALGRLLEGLAHVKEERKNKEIIYGFCSYNAERSKPLLSMIYNEGGKIQSSNYFHSLNAWKSKEGVVPANLWELSKREAYRLFLNGKSGAILGATDIIYQVRTMQKQGKGFNIKVENILPDGRERIFQDQVSAYGVIKQEDANKRMYCVEFLKMLISSEVQVELKQLGMFPVVKDVGEIYKDDPEMNLLEKNIPLYRWGPDDKYWSSIPKGAEEAN